MCHTIPSIRFSNETNSASANPHGQRAERLNAAWGTAICYGFVPKIERSDTPAQAMARALADCMLAARRYERSECGANFQSE